MLEPSVLFECLVTACAQDLCPVSYPKWTPEMKNKGIKKADAEIVERRPESPECRIYMFPQSWGSTALGYGGIGGAAITDAYTIAIEGPMGDYCIYFGSTRLAYHVRRPSSKFLEDLHAHNLAAVYKVSGYERDKKEA